MFISKTIICVQYVDDCLWLYRDQKELDKVVQLFLDDGESTTGKLVWTAQSLNTLELELKKLVQIK